MCKPHLTSAKKILAGFPPFPSSQTNKQQSRQSTRTPSRDVTKDLTQGVVEKEGGEESPITEETSESGARRSARKRKSVYGNLNEGQIHR